MSFVASYYRATKTWNVAELSRKIVETFSPVKL